MQTPLVARVLRLTVFALLLASASVAIVLSERMWQLWGLGALPRWAPLAAPVCFATFMFIFALDRLLAVRREQEAPARAIMQVGAAFLLLTLLLPQQALEMHRAKHRHAQTPETVGMEAPPMAPAELLLQHQDDAVREATCSLLAGEALGLTHPLPPGHPLESLREMLQDMTENDASPEVRSACAEALGQLSPMDELHMPNDACVEDPDFDGDNADSLPSPGRIDSL